MIDCVGGETLAAAIKATRYGGVVTCCGLVGSADLPLNVYPFILRGVRLIGIDSVECPVFSRLSVWKKLGGEWMPENLDKMVQESTLVDLEEKIDAVFKGALRGRTIVRLP